MTSDTPAATHLHGLQAYRPLLEALGTGTGGSR